LGVAKQATAVGDQSSSSTSDIRPDPAEDSIGPTEQRDGGQKEIAAEKSCYRW